jgi:hypothetical protein
LEAYDGNFSITFECAFMNVRKLYMNLLIEYVEVVEVESYN